MFISITDCPTLLNFFIPNIKLSQFSFLVFILKLYLKQFFKNFPFNPIFLNYGVIFPISGATRPLPLSTAVPVSIFLSFVHCKQILCSSIDFLWSNEPHIQQECVRKLLLRFDAKKWQRFDIWNNCLYSEDFTKLPFLQIKSWKEEFSDLKYSIFLPSISFFDF